MVLIIMVLRPSIREINIQGINRHGGMNSMTFRRSTTRTQPMEMTLHRCADREVA